MKISKKGIRRLIVMAIIILIIIIVSVVISNKKRKEPATALKQYLSCITEQKYEEMYDRLTEGSKKIISKEDFIKRNKNVYEGIEANNIIVEIKDITKEKDEAVVSYNIKMNTMGGKLNMDNEATLIKENKEYKLEWSSKSIFPNLGKDDKVKVKTVTAKRGEIQDRNGKILAGEGNASSVGLVPGKMSENKSEDIKKVAELLNVSEESINKLLLASYVKDDTFVPIKTIAKTEEELKNKLLQIKGIKITNSKDRIYTYGEKTSHLLGYTQNISSEELKNLQKDGYNQNSVIGKTGIEKQYENRLRAISGCEITIVDKDGKTKQTLARREAKNGENIKLTIDINLQAELYDQFVNDKSAHVAMDYTTGEILALVSTPTYNSNDFSFGISRK